MFADLLGKLKDASLSERQEIVKENIETTRAVHAENARKAAESCRVIQLTAPPPPVRQPPPPKRIIAGQPIVPAPAPRPAVRLTSANLTPEEAEKMAAAAEADEWRRKQSMSKAEASREAKGSNSYYSWQTVPADAAVVNPTPAPELLSEPTTLIGNETIKRIDKYSLLNEGAELLVYVALEGPLAAVRKANIEAEFHQKAFKVLAHTETGPYKLHIGAQSLPLSPFPTHGQTIP
jgi:hypothetical protein